jgi:predicted nucleic acid-binding protein
VTFAVVDTSVWSRGAQPAVRKALAEATERDRLATVDPLTLELLQSAQSARELRRLTARYALLHQIPLSPVIGRRALVVQAQLSRRGHHRGPSVVDLLTAAAAEAVGAEVWHCDRHFELIGGVTGQPMRRVGR